MFLQGPFSQSSKQMFFQFIYSILKTLAQKHYLNLIMERFTWNVFYVIDWLFQTVQHSKS